MKINHWPGFAREEMNGCVSTHILLQLKATIWDDIPNEGFPCSPSRNTAVYKLISMLWSSQRQTGLLVELSWPPGVACRAGSFHSVEEKQALVLSEDMSWSVLSSCSNGLIVIKIRINSYLQVQHRNTPQHSLVNQVHLITASSDESEISWNYLFFYLFVWGRGLTLFLSVWKTAMTVNVLATLKWCCMT